jgi:hypothetical protein
MAEAAPKCENFLYWDQGHRLHLVAGRTKVLDRTRTFAPGPHDLQPRWLPDEVFTVRTYATRAAYGPILVCKFSRKIR